MTESDFWSDIRLHCPAPDWTRIENTAMSGAPDVNGCLDGVDVWLELKIKKGNLIEIRHSQILWMRQRLTRNARNVWVVARDRDTLYVWAAARALVASHTPTRVIAKSMFIAPGEPDYKTVLPFNWREFQDFVFKHSRGRLLPESESN